MQNMTKKNKKQFINFTGKLKHRYYFSLNIAVKYDWLDITNYWLEMTN